MKYPLFALCSVILLSATLAFLMNRNSESATKLPPQETRSEPRFVTYHLAGVSLTDEHKWRKDSDYAGVHDPKSNYTLYYGNGPHGCEYVLTLKPGCTWSTGKEELQRVFQGVRLKLVTGRGVAIGDTPQEVERKIGKPTFIDMKAYKGMRDNKPYEILPNYTYIYKGERLYAARYSFKNGKLSEIRFRDARPPTKDNPYGGCP